MKTIVIGCGAVVENAYRRALNLLERRGYLNVIGMVDSNVNRLVRAKEWFPTARTFQSLVDCYAQLREVELTLITSPPPLHSEQAIMAFENGSHVFCEKPMASSLEEAKEMVASAQAHQKVLGIGMPRRFFPCLVEARRRIMAGELGSSIQFNHREGGVYKWPVATAAPFRRDSSGGGVLLDKGIHALDALYFLFGAGTVLKSADDAVSPGVEANALIELILERGRGNLQLSWDMELNSGLQIKGERGELWMPIGTLSVLWFRPRSNVPWQEVSPEADWPRDLERDGRNRGTPLVSLDCFVFQLVQMLRSIGLAERPAVAGEEALVPLELIQSAYSMATPLIKPWLSPAEQAAAERRHWHYSGPSRG
jgi:predicted dehydrogenase